MDLIWLLFGGQKMDTIRKESLRRFEKDEKVFTI
jgi:hypothetical protein